MNNFLKCHECEEDLSEMEMVYCEEMSKKSTRPYAICALCLKKEYDGEWPIPKS